jgi:ankyrin repeat protein
MSAAGCGLTDVVQVLIDGGAGLNGQDYDDKMTALMQAALNGHDECVKALLSAGADAQVQDANGYTAFDLACYEGHIECVRLLLTGRTQAEVRNGLESTVDVPVAALLCWQLIRDFTRTRGVALFWFQRVVERHSQPPHGKYFKRDLAEFVKAGSV